MPLGGAHGPDCPSFASDSPRASSSTALRQQEAPQRDGDDCENPSRSFVKEKERVSSMPDMRLSTVSDLAQQQQVDNDKENNTSTDFPKVPEVASEFKAALKKMDESISADLKMMEESISASIDAGAEKILAGLRQLQIKVDGEEVLNHSIEILRKQIKADQEETLQQTVTEPLGAMSINLVDMSQDMVALKNDVRGTKTALQHVESASATDAARGEELIASINHARRELGLPATDLTINDVLVIASSPVRNDRNIMQSLRRLQLACDVSTTPTFHSIPSVTDVPITSRDFNVPAAPAGPDVGAPKTPTISD